MSTPTYALLVEYGKLYIYLDTLIATARTEIILVIEQISLPHFGTECWHHTMADLQHFVSLHQADKHPILNNTPEAAYCPSVISHVNKITNLRSRPRLHVTSVSSGI